MSSCMMNSQALLTLSFLKRVGFGLAECGPQKFNKFNYSNSISKLNMGFKTSIFLVAIIALGIGSYFFHQEGNFDDLKTHYRFKIFKD